MRSRESRYERVAELAYRLTQRLLPVYRHKNSPHRYTWPQLAACVLLMFYLDSSYRDMEEWLLASDKICQRLGLPEVPDHATLCRAFHRLNLSHLRAMHCLLLRSIGVKETIIALDSTGLRTDQSSAYYHFRSGQPKRDWVKGTYAVGAESQFIVATHASYGRYQDSVLLERLRRQTRPHTHRSWLLLADAGFDGRQVKEGDLIPPVRRHGVLRAPERIARAELVAQARLDGLFGQRWKSETVHSVIKRKFGDTLRSRTKRFYFREVFVKSLIYNIHVV